MSQEKKQVRAAFRLDTFVRDRYRCRGCGFQSSPERAVAELDAHHISPREEMPAGGYVKENGISLCKFACHEKAENELQGRTDPGEFSKDKLYALIGSSYEVAVAASEKLERRNAKP